MGALAIGAALLHALLTLPLSYLLGRGTATRFWEDDGGLWHSHIWDCDPPISAASVHCYEGVGNALTIKSILEAGLDASGSDAVLIARFECLLHPSFGSRQYWAVRHRCCPSLVLSVTVLLIVSAIWHVCLWLQC